MANKDFKVKNGLDIQSPLPVSMGGTGQTTTGNTLNALLPSQTGNSSKVLSTDGTNTTWAAQAVAYQRGGTASRPVSPTAGDLYYNTDTNAFEQYTSSGWFIVAAAAGIPTGVTATNQGSGRAYNNGQSSVAFTAATSGGAPSSFTITPTPTTSPATFSGSSSPITVTGLASSTQYTYTATATSPYGTSAASSASAGVTATTVPQAPTINSVTAGDTQVSVAFTAGATGGSAITGYSITSSPASTTTTQSASSSPYTFTGLTNDTAYTFTMTATNANGVSAASSASSSATPLISISGDFESIQTINLGSNQSTITFSSIPQTYKHLQLRITGRTTHAGNSSEMGLKVNGVSGIYTRHLLYADGSTVNIDGRQEGDEYFFMTWIAGNNAAENIHGVCIVDFLDYRANKTKAISVLTALDRNGAGLVGIESSQINSTSAVSSITLITQPSGNNFMTNSHFALYGIKG